MILNVVDIKKTKGSINIDELKQLVSHWKDEKFQKLLIEQELFANLKQRKINSQLIIESITFTQKQLKKLLNTTIKIYSGLYARDIPSYAQKYTNETQLDFMKRWGQIISSLEKFHSILEEYKVQAFVLRF